MSKGKSFIVARDCVESQGQDFHECLTSRCVSHFKPTSVPTKGRVLSFHEAFYSVIVQRLCLELYVVNNVQETTSNALKSSVTQVGNKAPSKCSTKLLLIVRGWVRVHVCARARVCVREQTMPLLASVIKSLM